MPYSSRMSPGPAFRRNSLDPVKALFIFSKLYSASEATNRRSQGSVRGCFQGRRLEKSDIEMGMHSAARLLMWAGS